MLHVGHYWFPTRYVQYPSASAWIAGQEQTAAKVKKNAIYKQNMNDTPFYKQWK